MRAILKLYMVLLLSITLNVLLVIQKRTASVLLSSSSSSLSMVRAPAAASLTEEQRTTTTTEQQNEQEQQQQLLLQRRSSVATNKESTNDNVDQIVDDTDGVDQVKGDDSNNSNNKASEEEGSEEDTDPQNREDPRHHRHDHDQAENDQHDDQDFQVTLVTSYFAPPKWWLDQKQTLNSRQRQRQRQRQQQQQEEEEEEKEESSHVPGNSSSSLLATLSDSPYHPHREEIEAAILTNLHNTYIDQVVVVLDGIIEGETVNCDEFTNKMIEFRNANLNDDVGTSLESTRPTIESYIINDDDNATSQAAKPPKLPILTCVEHPQNKGQPTYGEMVQYSVSPDIVKSKVVTLINADHVFTGTLSTLPGPEFFYDGTGSKSPGRPVIVVITSRGYDKDTVPDVIRRHYRNYVSTTTLLDSENTTRVPDTSRFQRSSWDGYIFHRDVLKRGLDVYQEKKLLLQKQQQQQQNEIRNNTDYCSTKPPSPPESSTTVNKKKKKQPPPVPSPPILFHRCNKQLNLAPFYMNEMSGENAALGDIVEIVRLGSTYSSSSAADIAAGTTKSDIDPVISVVNGCYMTPLFHFHFAPKTHRPRPDDTRFIDTPGSGRTTTAVPEPRVGGVARPIHTIMINNPLEQLA